MATTDSVKQHKLRRLIAWLSDEEGRGMEFISLYIAREKSIGKIVAILKEESDSVAREVVKPLRAHKEPLKRFAVYRTCRLRRNVPTRWCESFLASSVPVNLLTAVGP